MKAIKLLALTFTYLCIFTSNLTASEANSSITVRVASYNVEFGKSATPEQIGEMFKPYNLDIIGFDEAPDGDWTARVGKVLGMKYSFVGTFCVCAVVLGLLEWKLNKAKPRFAVACVPLALSSTASHVVYAYWAQSVFSSGYYAELHFVAPAVFFGVLFIL